MIKNLLAYCLLELKVPAAINMVRNLRTGTRIESVKMSPVFIRLVLLGLNASLDNKKV